jgi:hypothetical protein
MLCCSIGLVLVVNDSLSASEDSDPSVAMWRACNYIFHHETPVKALSFITDVRLFINSHLVFVLFFILCCGFFLNALNICGLVTLTSGVPGCSER